MSLLTELTNKITFMFGILCTFSKNGKVQKRGKINLIGRLQLSTEKSKEEDNEGIMQLRILRVQVMPCFPWLILYGSCQLYNLGSSQEF